MIFPVFATIALSTSQTVHDIVHTPGYFEVEQTILDDSMEHRLVGVRTFSSPENVCDVRMDNANENFNYAGVS